MNRPPQLLVADFGATRLGVRMALAGQEVEICGEANDAAQAIARARLVQPDICLIGSELPGGGIAAVRGIQAAAPGAATILLAGIADATELLMAIRAGAIGYAPGTTTREQLCRTIRAVLAGEAVVPRSMVLTLTRALQTSARTVDEEPQREARWPGSAGGWSCKSENRSAARDLPLDGSTDQVAQAPPPHRPTLRA